MSNFQEILNGDTPVLVDFCADWCGPCKVMAPELKKLADQHGDNLRVLQGDVDKNPQAAMHSGVRGVPTLILFQKGEQLWRQSGAMSAAQLSSVIRQKTGV